MKADTLQLSTFLFTTCHHHHRHQFPYKHMGAAWVASCCQRHRFKLFPSLFDMLSDNKLYDNFKLFFDTYLAHRQTHVETFTWYNFNISARLQIIKIRWSSDYLTNTRQRIALILRGRYYHYWIFLYLLWMTEKILLRNETESLSALDC